jgi:hypothetical protein
VEPEEQQQPGLMKSTSSFVSGGAFVSEYVCSTSKTLAAKAPVISSSHAGKVHQQQQCSTIKGLLCKAHKMLVKAGHEFDGFWGALGSKVKAWSSGLKHTAKLGSGALWGHAWWQEQEALGGLRWLLMWSL